MFEVLVHTDCSSEESISGRSGFGFQAESPGATPADEALISGRLLHVVPTGLHPEHPEEHPPTCTWAAENGRYYLSRGRSTGRTLSGRPGNQVTQTIVTSSSADVLPLRPAQLFSSPSWNLERATSGSLDAWVTPLEIDPSFEIAALHEMVTSDPWAREMLPVFLTMVEQATATPRTRLVLSHPDQDVVMRWIALASLFEDPERSLAMTFAVYAANPLSVGASIIGAHPAISPNLIPQRAEGYAMVDLAQRTATPVEVSSSAALHAAWFLSGDPYQGLEAVETSRRWSVLVPRDVAARSAAVACLEDQDHAAGPSAALTMLSALARAGAHDDLEVHGDALLDAVLTRPAPPDGDMLPVAATLWDLRAAGENRFACSLAATALEWALGAPELGEAWSAHEAGSLARRRLVWPDPEEARRAAEVLGEILAACPDPALPRWFALAAALGTGLSEAAAEHQVRRLARHVASHPELNASLPSWLHADQVGSALEDELVTRLRSGDRKTREAVRSGAHDVLIGRDFVLDLETRPLSAWLVARTLDQKTEPERIDLVRRAAPVVTDADASLFLLRGAVAATPGEVAAWVRSRRHLDRPIAALAQDLVEADLHACRPEPLADLVGALGGPGVTGLTPRLEEAVTIHAALVAALSAPWSRGTRRSPELDHVAGLPRDWLLLRADDVAERLLLTKDGDAVHVLSRGSGDALHPAVGTAVRRLVAEADRDALVAPLRLMRINPDGFGPTARRALTDVWEDPVLGPTVQGFQDDLPPGWDQELDEFVASLARGRLARGVRRGARRILDARER